jgi:hypothetical protein
MAEKAITINTAPEAEAHIFAQDDAAIFHSILGGASGILPGESLMPATKISNNLVRIGPGVFSNQGYMVRIATGDYKDLTIDSGTAGMNRYDLIVAEFTRVGAVDSHVLKVVKGTATSGTPDDPTLTQQNLDQSGTVRQEPLYRVRLSGTTLTQIDLLATQLPNLNLVQEALTPVDCLAQITLNSEFSFGVNSYLIKMDRFVYFALQINKTSSFAVAEGVGVLPLEIRPYKFVGGSGTAGASVSVGINIQWTLNPNGNITVLTEGIVNVAYISGVYFLG